MQNKQIVTQFGRPEHHHDRCLDMAIKRAEQGCAQRGVRLTPLRRRVLQLVWRSHEPVKAYELLETLQSEKKGAAPPTIYRALDFLQEQGFVHKLESLNAYIGCSEPGHNETSQFLICHECGVVVELDDDEISNVINEKTQALGFTPSELTLEIKGLCDKCRPD
jgi:Fur family zinc uptake transcriptional regulator